MLPSWTITLTSYNWEANLAKYNVGISLIYESRRHFTWLVVGSFRWTSQSAHYCYTHTRYVTDDCLRLLVVSLVHTRLDYGNFVLVGLPAYLQRRMQSVLNAGARLVYRFRRYDHVTDALITLLAASARTGRLQSGCYGISCIAWSCPTIPQSASSCRWLAQPSPTPFFFVAPLARSTIPFVNCRSSFFSRRHGHTLEHTPSLPVFRQRLKTFLFHKSIPDVVWPAD